MRDDVKKVVVMATLVVVVVAIVVVVGGGGNDVWLRWRKVHGVLHVRLHQPAYFRHPGAVELFEPYQSEARMEGSCQLTLLLLQKILETLVNVD